MNLSFQGYLGFVLFFSPGHHKSSVPQVIVLKQIFGSGLDYSGGGGGGVLSSCWWLIFGGSSMFTENCDLK